MNIIDEEDFKRSKYYNKKFIVQYDSLHMVIPNVIIKHKNIKYKFGDIYVTCSPYNYPQAQTKYGHPHVFDYGICMGWQTNYHEAISSPNVSAVYIANLIEQILSNYNDDGHHKHPSYYSQDKYVCHLCSDRALIDPKVSDALSKKICKKCAPLCYDYNRFIYHPKDLILCPGCKYKIHKTIKCCTK